MTAKESGTSKPLEQSPLGSSSRGKLRSYFCDGQSGTSQLVGQDSAEEIEPTSQPMKTYGKQHWSADSGIDVGGYRSGRS